MANPYHQLITTALNNSDAILQPDWMQSPFTLSYAIEVPAGISASFLLRYTLDAVDVLGLPPNSQPTMIWTPIWVPDPTNGTTKAVTGPGVIAGLYTWPIRALRIDVSSLTGSYVQYNGVTVTNIRFSALQGMSSR